MTVYLPKDCRTWRYNFYIAKQRYSGSTGETRKADALTWETKEKARIRRKARGLEPLDPEDTPRIQDWAAVYYEHAAAHVTRPERIADLLRVVLRFWGGRPSGKNPQNPIVEGEPYRDLRLGHPIADPDLIAQFEDWMAARGIAGQTKNQYRSVMNQLYKLAWQPTYRKRTGVTLNPFRDLARDVGGTRDVTITPEALRRVLGQASYHVRLAVAIGALAPKLRLGNILALRWTDLDSAWRFITVQRHKTRTHTGRPLVFPISAQLRRILKDARARTRGDRVVTYRGRAVGSIRAGIAAAAKAAGVPYGRFTEDGVTFHTLRHTAATLLAELDVAEGKRKSVMGHKRIETTQQYTHLRPVHELAPLELLSEELPIADLVMVPWRRASRKPALQPVSIDPAGPETPREQSGDSERPDRRRDAR